MFRKPAAFERNGHVLTPGKLEPLENPVANDNERRHCREIKEIFKEQLRDFLDAEIGQGIEKGLLPSRHQDDDLNK